MILSEHQQILDALENAKAVTKAAEDLVAWARSIGIPPDAATLAALEQLRALSNMTPEQLADLRDTIR